MIVPVAASMLCYGKSHGQLGLCQGCQYHTPCGKAKAEISTGYIAIDQAKFNLLPPRWADCVWTLNDEMAQLYYESYRIVFADQFAPDRPDPRSGIWTAINAGAAEVGCTVTLFMLTVMASHQEANRGVKFFANLLAGPAAMRRATAYKKAVQDQFGQFSGTHLDKFISQEYSSAHPQTELENGEQIAGAWIMGYCSKRANFTFETFRDVMESQLPDSWLATSSGYGKFLAEWQKNKTGSDVEKSKRSRVSRLIGELKRDSGRAKHLFILQQQVMAAVIRRVLSNKGFQVAQFRVKEAVVWDNTPDFWRTLGGAIKNHWEMELVYGNKFAAQQMLKSGGIAT